ncbi:DUF3372 domain-containing protein [Ahniella affigens]|uniref:DUF3372 domain-containing protein n=2 Tax=Ahniella affigens TaxID=2021234 RepID=A0A2P1PZ47_9GAMM|nr:DUF3372 domain-containing protein [Ahniella affigens]
MAGFATARAASLGDCDQASHATTLSASAPGTATDASAVWLNDRLLRWPGLSGANQYRLYGSARAAVQASAGNVVVGAAWQLPLTVSAEALPTDLAARYAYLGSGVQLQLAESDRQTMASQLSAQWILVQEDANRRVIRATHLQWPGYLDARFAAAADAALGTSVGAAQTRFRLWAPTAQAVAVCLYPDARATATELIDLQPDTATGVWSVDLNRDLHGQVFTYLVDVYVRGTGLVRNRVTDPYSVSLTANSKRSGILDLKRADTMPLHWGQRAKRLRRARATDMVIYELHVRDFSANDPSVPADHRGKYLAFTDTDSQGMHHLQALADAGLTDVHLLPVFDLATVPELNCAEPVITGSGDSGNPQAIIQNQKSNDCFNWGYDPFHFTAPEGSYATDPEDPRVRVREFRAMVQGLNQLGLSVGMDVVYNHTSAAGQDAKSVLDRIVPGYYQRLNAQGGAETSTCCQNTATEHLMMAKLMIDSTVTWVREFGIESFRFDLMGHQPRDAMLRLQAAVDAARDRSVPLLGEGWNFGEIANGSRFVQASQLSLNGTGIGTFSDRARDAVRGGGPGDNDQRLISAQGYINGLLYDRNAQGSGNTQDLMRTADLVRVGLAGSIRSYEFQDYLGQTKRLEQIQYGGSQPAGYVLEPSEVVNYVENHDNQTLFDINVFKLPTATSKDDRARAQMLAVAINMFSQGTAYFHAGVELLRSKSLDRNSYDSGDWFNRLDFSATDNYFATGLPPQQDNGATWGLMRPYLNNPGIKPEPAQIRFARAMFLDLLRIRASTQLLRLPTAAAIHSRLRFANTGPSQIPTLLVGRLDGRGLVGERFQALTYLINVDKNPVSITIADAADQDWVLHPVQRSPRSADARLRKDSRFDRATGRFTIPARTAAVFVLE